MTSAIAPTADPPLADALAELTAFGLRMVRAITEVTEAEQRTVAVVAAWLPEPGTVATSVTEAQQLGIAIDSANEALAHANPRLAKLSHCFDQLARAVRRGVALARRLEQGWPPPRAMTDNRRTLLLRQAARGVGEAIRARTQGDPEAEERLFADLALSLEDPGFEDLLERPVEEIVQILCRELGLPPQAARPAPLEAAPKPSHPPPRGRRHDPG